MEDEINNLKSLEKKGVTDRDTLKQALASQAKLQKADRKTLKGQLTKTAKGLEDKMKAFLDEKLKPVIANVKDLEEDWNQNKANLNKLSGMINVIDKNEAPKKNVEKKDA